MQKPTNKYYTILRKIANMRKSCLQKQIGNTTDLVRHKYAALQNYVNCTANYSEEAIKAYIKKHYADLLIVVPANQAGKKLITELNQLAQ